VAASEVTVEVSVNVKAPRIFKPQCVRL